MTQNESGETAPITIKKYANRRLYNTATSSYVTLDHLCQMVKEGTEFVVYDAKTGEDITRSVLTQIIVEEEAKGQNMLPIGFLRQLISLYGDSMQWMVPKYLDYSMQTFARNQEQMRNYFQEAMSGVFPFNAFEEMGKQNMAMFERALKMFAPFGGAQQGPQPDAKPAGRDSDKALEELQRRLDELQKQMEAMSRSSSGKH